MTVERIPVRRKPQQILVFSLWRPLPQSMGRWGLYMLHCQVKCFIYFYVYGSSVRLIKWSLGFIWGTINVCYQEMSCVLLLC